MQTIPFPTLVGALSFFVDADQPIGSMGSTDALAVRLVITANTADADDDAVLELRDDSDALAEITLPATAELAELVLDFTIPAGTALFLRPTTGDNQIHVGGFLEIDPLGSAAALSALTTVDRVKTYAGIPDASSDAILALLVAAVSARMQTYMRRSITTEAVTEIHSGDGERDYIQLRAYPLQGVALLSIDGVYVSVANDLELDLALARVYYRPALGDLTPFAAGRRNISVTYVAGFAAVPDDLTDAATLQTVWAYKRTKPGGDRAGLRDNVIGDAQGTFLVDAWAPEVRETLDRYRRWLAG